MPQVITWHDITNESRGPSWPRNLSLRRDPGDSAGFDGGTRSETHFVFGENCVQYFCAHVRTTVRVNVGDGPPLKRRELARLILYVCSVGHVCHCFRADWRKLTGQKFGRYPAIAAWRWVEETIGYQNVQARWAERTPPGREWSWYESLANKREADGSPGSHSARRRRQ
jgi:hypothetical protein